MTDAVQIAIIVAIGPTVIGLAGVLVSWLNGRKIQDVHTIMNSRLSELLESNRASSHAKGMADQRDLDKDKTA